MVKNMKLLIISHCAPYDTVGTAGEKTHNYYLKFFSKQSDIDVRLITVCKSTDVEKLDLDSYGIKSQILIENQCKFVSFKRKFIRAISLIFNPNDKYANFVSKERQRFFCNAMKRWQITGYTPDCIILEFTHNILLVTKVKEIFPGIPIIGSSHDVNYKGSYRLWQFEKNPLIKYFRYRQYHNLKQREIEAILSCDLIVTQNVNDIRIFRENFVLKNKKYVRIVPYYDSYSHLKRISDGKTIIFFGSMGRQENYLSVQWFIEEVFNKLDNDMQFVVIGGNPPARLRKYESARIHITGFLTQEEVETYFAKCVCMVAPLLLGSGIKVKILEAFSGGIPVVTNEIGNEGIFAKDQEQILYCETAQEFIKTLKEISNTHIDIQHIGVHGKEYVTQQFNLEQSRDTYLSAVRKLVGCE
jgi:glycosyltransferase involved in cell wall biosynthesis